MVSDNTQAFIRFALVLLLVFLAIKYYGEWSAERDEGARRASLTTEQRALEDSKSRALRDQKTRLRVAAEKERPFRDACRTALLNSLHDPMSATINYTVGAFGADGSYSATFEGRAKNLMGAYVLGTWSCQAVGGAQSVLVTKIVQFRP